MKVWITKYALTSGTFEIEATLCADISDGMISYQRSPSHYKEYAHGEGRDWHKTKASVLDRVAQMKEKKIASLKKQIKKIEAITV